MILWSTLASPEPFIKRHEGKIILLVLVYIDDMAMTSSDTFYIMFFKSFLNKDFEITDLGSLSHMLGVLVTRDWQNHLIYLNQAAYIQQTIIQFEMQDAAPVSIPLIVKHKLSSSQSPQTEAEKHAYKSYTHDMHYLSLVGSLLFATQTRSDIQYTVGLVTQFGANLGVAHLEATKRILRYLKSTTDYHLVLGK